jgi:hypothetical protein
VGHVVSLADVSSVATRCERCASESWWAEVGILVCGREEVEEEGGRKARNRVDKRLRTDCANFHIFAKLVGTHTHNS